MQETGEISEAQPIREGGDKDVAEILSGYTFTWRPFHTIKIQPLFRSPFARRFLSAILAFLILVPLILILFRLGTTDAAWYSDTWKFRKLITINSAKVPSTQTNFPVLVSITDSGLKSHAQGTGNDILFTSSDGSTKLSHEIETFATGSGKLNAWVKIPSLSATTDTKIYLYYGNPSAPSQQDPANVWDTNFKAVWHLKENPAGTAPQMKDSTTNANNGTTNGSMASSQQTGGQINGSLDFDGVNDNVNVGDLNNATDGVSYLSVSVWIKQNALDADNSVISKWGATSSWDFFSAGTCPGEDTKEMTFVIVGGSSGACSNTDAHATNVWEHWVAVFDGTQADNATRLKLYKNGQLMSVSYQGTIPATTNSDDNPIRIGADSGQTSGFFWNGSIDEVRISNTVRSADWITTEYNNQSDPASFLTVGQQAENKNAPVGWWKFDEGQGTIANNSGTCGTACNGTLTGMASPATYNSGWTENGKINKALAFDKTDDYVNAGSDQAIDNITEKTVCAWIYPRSIGELNGGNNYGEIVTKFVGSNGWALELANQDGGQAGLYYYHGFTTGAGYWRTPNGTGPALNAWSHVCVAYNNSSAANDPTFYVNGVSPGLVEYSTPGGVSIDESAGNVLIGNLPDTSQTFDGLIDDVRIYDYALSPDQIKVVYNRTLSASEIQSLASTPCHRYTSGSTIPSGFGAPWDVLSPAQELLLTTLCGQETAQVTIGTGNTTQYIWPEAYVSKSKGVWEKITLSGTQVSPSGAWLVGTGTVSISAVNPDAVNYLAAYVCTFKDGAWKCGCKDAACTGATANLWQIQRFGK